MPEPRDLAVYAKVQTPSKDGRVYLHESSAVWEGTPDGPVEGPFVWLRVYYGTAGAHAHLGESEARQVRDGLNEFLRGVETSHARKEIEREQVRQEGPVHRRRPAEAFPDREGDSGGTTDD